LYTHHEMMFVTGTADYMNVDYKSVSKGNGGVSTDVMTRE